MCREYVLNLRGAQTTLTIRYRILYVDILDYTICYMFVCMQQFGFGFGYLCVCNCNCNCNCNNRNFKGTTLNLASDILNQNPIYSIINRILALLRY